MTSKERILNILNHKPVDQIGVYERFWGETRELWEEEGHIQKGESFVNHFDLDIEECSWVLNMTVDIDFVPEVVDEDEDTITIKNGNGAILKGHKHHSATYDHIGFMVNEQEDWDKVKDKLFVEARRINFERYRESREKAKREGKLFVWGGVNVFELMHPICGHENMLAAMILEPEWILEMTGQLMDVTLGLLEILFEQEGYPDAIWFFEDMGYKFKPFMSPAMYRQFIMPSHIKSCNYAHSHNMPVIMHSCGYIEDLLPHMIEAGIDCLQAIEIKAGMDLLKIYHEYGDKIAFMGGIDVRVLGTNDKKQIDEELEKKIPIVKEGYGYVLHSDHSIPPNVTYETFQYYLKKARELGAY